MTTQETNMMGPPRFFDAVSTTRIRLWVFTIFAPPFFSPWLVYLRVCESRRAARQTAKDDVEGGSFHFIFILQSFISVSSGPVVPMTHQSTKRSRKLGEGARLFPNVPITGKM